MMGNLCYMSLYLISVLHCLCNKGTSLINSPVCTSQGIHESGGPSLEYHQLERLVEIVVSPYLNNVLQNRNQLLLGQYH